MGKGKDEIRGAAGGPLSLCQELDLICCLGIWDLRSFKQSTFMWHRVWGPFQRGWDITVIWLMTFLPFQVLSSTPTCLKAFPP